MINIINRYCLVFSILLLFAVSTKAQLVYLGDDDVQKNKEDGYQNSRKTTGLVVVDGKNYFATPNGTFFESDGTETNTKIIKQFIPQNFPYLNATNKYVYFGYAGNNTDNSRLITRYNQSSGVQYIVVPTNYNKNLLLNSIVTPGHTFLVSETFTNYDKNTLLIRHFASDKFYIYAIEDAINNPEADLVSTKELDMNNVNTPISTNTELEMLNGEVYYNGRIKPTGVYETSTSIYKKTEADKRKYELKTSFGLLKNKIYPYDRFLRTKSNIYTFVKEVDSLGKYYHFLMRYKDNNIGAVSTSGITTKETDFDAQTMDGTIYLSCKGYLFKFNEPKGEYEIIINDKNATKGWDYIQKNKRFLKVGNYFMYRQNGALSIYNANTKTTKEITKEALAKNYNFFTQHNIYAYAGKNSFYFTQRINDKEVFTKYNPTDNTYTPITFPSFKKQDFEEIKAILHNENKFVFLTSYLGKKNKPVYKMFMYTEEGNALTETPITNVNTQINITPKPAPSFDISKFNKKLFKEQLIKIVSNQGNQFADITGNTIPSDFNNKKSSTINLDGFKEGAIIDYKSVSRLMRYETETLSIKGKANTIAFLDILDKEVQSIIAGQGIKKIVEADMKFRKEFIYIFEGNVGYNANDIKFLQLVAYCNADFENPDEAIFTITLRADKPARY